MLLGCGLPAVWALAPRWHPSVLWAGPGAQVPPRWARRLPPVRLPCATSFTSCGPRHALRSVSSPAGVLVACGT